MAFELRQFAFGLAAAQLVPCSRPRGSAASRPSACSTSRSPRRGCRTSTGPRRRRRRRRRRASSTWHVAMHAAGRRWETRPPSSTCTQSGESRRPYRSRAPRRSTSSTSRRRTPPSSRALRCSSAARRPGAPALQVRGAAVEFDAVRFGYDPERTILHGVSLKVGAGDQVTGSHPPLCCEQIWLSEKQKTGSHLPDRVGSAGCSLELTPGDRPQRDPGVSGPTPGVDSREWFSSVRFSSATPGSCRLLGLGG